MSYVSSSGFCFSFSEMQKRSRLVYQGAKCEHIWTDIKESIQATKRFDLAKVQKDLIIAYLMEEPTYGVFELKDPYIIAYRWPFTGEYREFLLTNDFYIVESPKHKIWYQSYPFISVINKKIFFDTSKASFESINDTLAWFPHSDNYTHFHLDFFGPWAEYFSQNKSLPVSRVITRREDNQDWKRDFFQAFNSTHMTYESLLPGDLKLYKLKKALVPISPSVCRTLHYTRKFHSNLFGQYIITNDTSSIPILYMKRADNDVQRVVNNKEIEDIVSIYGGISIDISSLTYADKMKTISNSKVLIVEGSGVTNALLFSKKNCHIIILSAEETRREITFSIGGWLYSAMLGNRITIIKSIGKKIFNGSPIGGYKYSKIEIQEAIENNINL